MYFRLKLGFSLHFDEDTENKIGNKNWIWLGFVWKRLCPEIKARVWVSVYELCIYISKGNIFTILSSLF